MRAELNYFSTNMNLIVYLLQLLEDGNSQYLLPNGYYWQMCHTHYSFDPPVFYFSRIQDNHTSSCFNSAVISSICLDKFHMVYFHEKSYCMQL